MHLMSPPDIRKSHTGTAFHRMTPLRVDSCAINTDPSALCTHQTEVQMIDHRMDVASLTPGASDDQLGLQNRIRMHNPCLLHHRHLLD